MESFERAIVDAIANQFFESKPSHTDPSTGQVYFNQAPAWNLASQLFRNNETKIMEKVIERLDIDALATKVSEQVIIKLTEKEGVWGHRNDVPQFRNDLRAAVIDKLAEAEADAIRERMSQEGTDEPS